MLFVHILFRILFVVKVCEHRICIRMLLLICVYTLCALKEPDYSFGAVVFT